MKTILLFIFSLLSATVFSQSVLMGTVTDENGTPAADVYILNLQTGKETYSNRYGTFSIPAKAGEIVRLVSTQFERKDKKITQQDFKANMEIPLETRYIDIKEVKIGFIPTGDLRYDLNRLPRRKKDEEVNYKIQQSIAMGAPNITEPHLKTPSMFRSPINTGTPIISINLSDFSRKKKNEVQPPLKLSQYSSTIRAVLGKEFFNKLKIPEDKTKEFVTWVLIQHAEVAVLYLKQRDWSTVRMWLEDGAEDFLAML